MGERPTIVTVLLSSLEGETKRLVDEELRKLRRHRKLRQFAVVIVRDAPHKDGYVAFAGVEATSKSEGYAHQIARSHTLGPGAKIYVINIEA